MTLTRGGTNPGEANHNGIRRPAESLRTGIMAANQRRCAVFRTTSAATRRNQVHGEAHPHHRQSGQFGMLRHEVPPMDHGSPRRTRVYLTVANERATLTMAKAIFAQARGALTMPTRRIMPTRRTPYGTRHGTRQGEATLAPATLYRWKEAF